MDRTPLRLITLLLLALAALPAHALDRLTLNTADGPRQALLLNPKAPGPRPLLLLFHGHGGSAAQLLAERKLMASPLSVWADIARREQIVVAALDGARGADGLQGWNDCRRDAANNPSTDDVAFARQLAQQLVQEGRVDARRVYAMGMSNGAMMVLRLGQDMPELTALAAVAGSMAADSECAASPQPGVAALLIHGDADPVVPYAGGAVMAGEKFRGTVLGAAASLARWAQAQGLHGQARKEPLPPRLAGDDTRGLLQFWGPRPAESPVALLTVQGGGHVEPSLSERYRRPWLRRVGAQSSVVESAEFAWAFFQRHAKP